MYMYLQVCPPGLHLSLGIFLRLFNLLETACKRLDIRVHLTGVGAGATYEHYVEAHTKQNSIKERVEQEEIQVKNLEQAGLLLSLKSSQQPNAAEQPHCPEKSSIT